MSVGMLRLGLKLGLCGAGVGRGGGVVKQVRLYVCAAGEEARLLECPQRHQ